MLHPSVARVNEIDDMTDEEAKVPGSDDDDDIRSQEVVIASANHHAHLDGNRDGGASKDAPTAQGASLMSVPPARAKEVAAQFGEEIGNN